MEDVKINVKFKLAALWIVLMFLYIYADFLSLYRPGQLSEILLGRLGPFEVTQKSLLAASIVVIIPAIMVFLSLIMKPRVNRRVNIILGIIFILINISNLVGESWVYYFLFGILEIVTALLIIWYAWKWPNREERVG